MTSNSTCSDMEGQYQFTCSPFVDMQMRFEVSKVEIVFIKKKGEVKAKTSWMGVGRWLCKIAWYFKLVGMLWAQLFGSWRAGEETNAFGWWQVGRFRTWPATWSKGGGPQIIVYYFQLVMSTIEVSVFFKCLETKFRDLFDSPCGPSENRSVMKLTKGPDSFPCFTEEETEPKNSSTRLGTHS